MPKSLPTKDLFEHFVRLRKSTRRAAFYAFAAGAILLAWSRSPNVYLTYPVVVDEAQKGLAFSPTFAPIFGPIIALFFYANLYTVHREALAMGRVLSRRLGRPRLRSVIEPPFVIRKDRITDSILFILVGLIATPLLTIWLFADFLSLSHGDQQMWHSLLLVCRMWGVQPEHRGHTAPYYVYGFPQSWMYVGLTAFELWMLWRVCRDAQKNAWN
jgi:hypothetical protein